MGAENLTGNLPNKVQGEYQRPLPREFENGSIGDTSWKDENGVLNWDSLGVLPKCISVADFSSAPPTEVDGAIYIGTTDTSAVHADWDGANKYDWVRFTADSSSWGAVTPSEGVLCYDSSANAWYSSDTSANGWNELQTVVNSETSYTKKTIQIGDWNMYLTGSYTKNVAHGLSATEWKTVRSVNVIIREDTDVAYFDLMGYLSASSTTSPAGLQYIDSSDFSLYHNIGSYFDSTDFDSTSYNRGNITFEYIKD